MSGANPFLHSVVCTQICDIMASEHVNGNGTEEPMDTSATATHSESFQSLLEAGLPQKVAEKLDEIYIAGVNAIIRQSGLLAVRRFSYSQLCVVSLHLTLGGLSGCLCAAVE